jgi:hypothetical protein
MSKKLISLLLAVMLTFSMVAVAAVSVSAETSDDSASSSPYLTVNATSNLFGDAVTEYNEGTNQVTVTYLMNADIPLINFEVDFTYDSNVLSVDKSVKSSTWSPLTGSAAVFNKGISGLISANASSLGGYESNGVFAQLVFNVNEGLTAPITTTVNANMKVISFGEVDEDTEMLINDTHKYLMTNSTLDEDYAKEINFTASTEITPESDFVPSTEPETTVPVTEAPTTEAPTATVAPATAAPTTDAQDTTTAPSTPYLTVNATSNLFGTATGVYDAETNQVVVTYYFDADLPVINFETTISYDPAVLSVDSSVKASTWSPNLKVSGQVFNKDLDGQIKINASSLSGYEFGGTFAQITFNVNDISAIAPTTTTVDLDMAVISYGEIDEDSEMLIDPTHVYLMKSHTVDQDVANAINFTSHTELTPDTFVEDTTTEPATTVAPTTVAPTTAEPTTVAPTTVAPTTAEPTTVEPTTVAPTEPTDVTYKYYIAGTENLFVTNWDGTGASNEMTLGEDGLYSLVITAENAPLDAQFKVVKIGDDGTTEWIGPEIGNYAFTVTDVCDVTITYNPVTGEVTYAGDYVIPTVLNIDAIYAVGNGDGNWLYDAAWDPAADENKMTQVSDGVYTITYTDVDAYDNYQVKFAANGTWADSWGGVYTESGVAEDAVYNGDNIIVEVPEDGSTVTLTLDLSAFDYASKTGAKFTITVTDGQEPTVEPTTVEPTTVEPTTVEPTTVAPTTAEPTTVEPTTVAPTTVEPTTVEPTTVASGLDITATSNLFPSNNYKAEVGETVSVAYVLDSDKAVLNTTWVLNYDPSVLELVDSNDFMPQMSNATLYNTENAGVVEGSASDLNLYDVTADQPFVVATFNVIGEGDTTVDLYVKVLTVSERDENGMDIEDKETTIVKNGVVETTEGYTVDTVFNFVPTPTVEPTTVEPTTVAPTTVEPTTEAPTTVEPTTEAPTTVEPTTVAPTTEEPTEAPTTVIAPTTSSDAQSSTAAPTTTKSASTSDTASKTTTSSTGSVQTGEASMAIIILSILVAATGVMFVLRKKELF